MRFYRDLRVNRDRWENCVYICSMTPLQIKNNLIRSIKKVDDPELLADLCRLLNLEVENIEELKTPANIKDSVTKGFWDIRNGRYLSNRKADTEMDQWLKK